MKTPAKDTGSDEHVELEQDELSFDDVAEVVGGLDHGWWPDRDAVDDPLTGLSSSIPQAGGAR
jgi:hypothetical protein